MDFVESLSKATLLLVFTLLVTMCVFLMWAMLSAMGVL